jgi:ribosome-interacting GTPase 1
MPTNLPPEAQELERLYRAAETVEEKISTLEDYISAIPKHKGTDHLRADLRRKLSKLKSSAQTRKGAARQVSPYHIDREGAGQLIVVGMTNVGKSSLVAALTNATPEVSAAPYTTWGPTPGMMLAKNVQIQIIDSPPLNEEYVDPEFMNLVRRCDLIVVVIDLQSFPIQQLEDTLSILANHRILPEHQQQTYRGEQRVTYKPVLVVVNKTDDETLDGDFEVLCELLEEVPCPLLPISAETGRGLEEFGQEVFERLGIMRVYSRAPGKEPDYSSPFVMEKGGTVEEFARQIHHDFYHNLKSARVWGSGVHDGQMVGRDHILHDEDIVELKT